MKAIIHFIQIVKSKTCILGALGFYPIVAGEVSVDESGKRSPAALAAVVNSQRLPIVNSLFHQL